MSFLVVLARETPKPKRNKNKLERLKLYYQEMAMTFALLACLLALYKQKRPERNNKNYQFKKRRAFLFRSNGRLIIDELRATITFDICADFRGKEKQFWRERRESVLSLNREWKTRVGEDVLQQSSVNSIIPNDKCLL